MDNKGNTWESCEFDGNTSELDGETLFTMFKGFLWLILIGFVVMIVMGLSEFLVYAQRTLLAPYAAVYQNLLFELLFYPSHFDRVHHIFEDRWLARVFLLLFIGASFTGLFLSIKKKTLKVYLGINVGILLLRVIFIVAVVIFEASVVETLTDNEIILTKLQIDVQEKKEITGQWLDTYSRVNLAEDYDLSYVANENEKLTKLVIGFGPAFNLGPPKPTEPYILTDFVLGGDAIAEAKDFNRFQTTIFYTPDEEIVSNNDTYTLHFLSDGKVLQTYQFAAEQKVIPVDLSVEAEESFSFKIYGATENSARIVMIGTQFSHRFY